jgi:hypothetical protein
MQSLDGKGPGVTAPTTGNLATAADTDLCLYDSGYGTNGTVNATLNACNFADAATTWKVANNTLQVGTATRCLQVAGDGTAVQVAKCNGSASQFFADNLGRFRSKSGKCLYTPAGTLQNGSILRLGSCNNLVRGFWQMF